MVKTLWPPQPGTGRWRDAFGDSLVCVRYRHDARRGHRYTTVELLVDHAPVRVVRGGSKAWALTMSRVKPDMRRKLVQSGAEWDPAIDAWRLSMPIAKRLGLANRVRRCDVEVERAPSVAKKVR